MTTTKLSPTQRKALEIIHSDPDGDGEYVAGGGSIVALRTAEALARRGLVEIVAAWSVEEGARYWRKRSQHHKARRVHYVAVRPRR